LCMAKYQLLLPKMGESVAEATIIKWLKKPGDNIEADESVMDIATDKVDSEVPSPVAGKLIEQLCKEDDVVQVGSVIAIIETGGDEASSTPAPVAETPKEPEPQTTTFNAPVTVSPEVKAEEPEPKGIPGIEQLPANNTDSGSIQVSENIRFYSPLVRSIAAQEGIGQAELDRISGSGAEGRLTKDDLLYYIRNRSAGTTTASPAAEPFVQEPVVEQKEEPVITPEAKPEPVAETTPTPAYKTVEEPKAQLQPEPTPAPKVAQEEPKAASVSGGDEIIEMDRMRRLIADHMIYSKHTSPHVTSFVEADVTALVKWRERVKDKFEKREGEKITFTPIFIEAVVKAIRDFPMINVSVNGTQIIKKRDINISMATALPNGNLIVPVIKKADELNLLGITKSVNDLANRARNGKLLPDDVKDGTFTITNVGSFGNVMGTPIINQPQVAILAVGAIKKKPAVIETKLGDMIGIRHMMFLSLSYDHRVVDGALGGSFVRKVADYLENWDLNREI
jgi:2-oxoglutarate dehydrogenase E2 component (dihydrolipoamide succinyltransferase)